MGPLITEKEAAALLSISERYLRKLRQRGEGPRVVKIGKLVRYDPESIREFVSRNSTDPSLVAGLQAAPSAS